MAERTTFQLGAKLGVGYSGGIRNAILISDTSVSSLARPHICQDLVIAAGFSALCEPCQHFVERARDPHDVPTV